MLLCFSLGACVVLGLSVGAVPIPWLDLASGTASSLQKTVFVEIRSPRVVLAGIVGAAIAMSGGVLQGLLRNPLADPQLIGVSSGAALGAIAMIVLGSKLSLPSALLPYAMPLAAIAGAMLVISFLYMFAGYFGQFSILTVILVGIAINALAMVGVGIFQYISDDAQLRSLVFWMMGSFGRATWVTVIPASILMLVSMWVLLSQSQNIDRLQLGEAEAMHMGVNVKRTKRILILTTACAVGAGVSLAGIIGFVGLVVPHLARMLMGARHQVLLPASALMGAALMILADLASRVAIVPAELPVSLVTSGLGAPFFLWLIARTRPQ
jgi:iron complex transport system permease protein